ncbi:MAG: hypothetical protein ACUVQ0_01525 [Thermoproteota archaeon]
MEAASEKVFKCSNCGGPLDYTPETLVCVCEYCGTLNWFSTQRFEIFVMPTHTRDEIINAFWRRMRSDKDMSRVYDKIELVETQGFYVPILIGDVSARGEWIGFRTVLEKRDKSYVTKTVTEKGFFNTSLRIAQKARRGAVEYGLEEMVSQAKNASEPLPIASVDWRKVGLQVLNPELSPDEAVYELSDIAEDELRERIRSSKGLEGFYYYSCEAKVNSFWIVLAPLWSLVYKYRGGIYRASISGYDLQFLRVSEPVFLRQRILYFAGCALTILLGAFTLPIMLIARGWLWVGVFVLLCLAGFSLARRSVSDVREERWK